MTTDRPRRATTQTEPNRINHLFWRLADEETSSVLRDPEWVVKKWLLAVDGLEGRRRDRDTAQLALSFLMRLEKDPFYASPEQTRGGDKDSSGLVYSLALLLFERLTGHHPFVESLSPLESRIRRDRAQRVGKNNLCHLSSRLRTLLHKALSPFAEDRYQDVASFRADIENWQREEEQSLVAPLQSAPLAQSPQAIPKPRARATEPPPPPPARKRFVESDTLQGAVMVSEASENAAGSSARKPPAPWMWPTISGGFAFVAALALFVAFKANTQASPISQSPSTAAATQPLGPSIAAPAALEAPRPAASETPATSEEVIEFSEADAEPLATGDAQEQTVAVVRDCVASAKFRGGLDIGLSLLFNDEGVVSRSFTGKLPITRAEGACIKSGLEGVATSDTEQMGKMMRYDLYLSLDAERVRVHPAR